MIKKLNSNYKFLFAIIILSVLVSQSCFVKENGGRACTSLSFEESFEDYSPGAFPNKHPWSYYGSEFGKIDVSVVDNGCIDGDKCLKINRFSVSNDPMYQAYVGVNTGCYVDYPIIYSQFFIKYLYNDTKLSIVFAAGSNFNIYMSSYGLFVSPGNKKVVEEGFIKPGSWYRIEIRLNYPDPTLLDIKVYEGNSLVLMNGSTGISSISVNKKVESSEYKFINNIHFENNSLYLYEHPNSDLNMFSFFIDAFSISNNKDVLKAGF